MFSVIDSEVAFRGRIATVRIDTLTMPGGGTAKREVVGHDRAVAVVAVDDAGRVVMIEQFRHPMRRRLWELPAGLMDIDGESAQPAAARELAEETGIEATDWSVLLDVATSPGFTDEVVRVFLATGLTDIGRQGAIEHEEADLKISRVALADAVRAALAGDIVNASAVAGLLAASIVLGIAPSGGPGVLRPADADWTSGAGVVHTGPGVPDAPVLRHGG
ncbi:NUDIX hydrolase [Nakamurella sp. UYEF19]|uniref:NUDIX hydrolase n=1 Tax=Nakamurella sp. UYEF19 TaxID=1756392 RepID=UPI003391278A